MNRAGPSRCKPCLGAASARSWVVASVHRKCLGPTDRAGIEAHAGALSITRLEGRRWREEAVACCYGANYSVVWESSTHGYDAWRDRLERQERRLR